MLSVTFNIEYGRLQPHVVSVSLVIWCWLSNVELVLETNAETHNGKISKVR